MKEYKLFNTDSKTFFDFRSDSETRCEGFTLSFLDDGTVCMSGDYGCLCWKRNYNGEKDYGFPGKSTGIGYFAEKVQQFGIKQVIMEFNIEQALKEIKEYANDKDEDGNMEDFEKLEERVKYLEDGEDRQFYDAAHEIFPNFEFGNTGLVYTEHFKSIFEILKSVSDIVFNTIKAKTNSSPDKKPNQSIMCKLVNMNDLKDIVARYTSVPKYRRHLVNEIKKWIATQLNKIEGPKCEADAQDTFENIMDEIRKSLRLGKRYGKKG